MVDAMRAALDELMGKERDVPLPERSGRRIKFTDELVCKYELAGLCPNRLFKNTKSDLGPCKYEIHDDHLEWEGILNSWNQLDDRTKFEYGYEKELIKYLDQLIREMDRKIQKAKERAEKESAPKPVKPEDQVRLDEIQGKMKEALEKASRLGEEGDVDGSLLFAQQADNFKQQHESLLTALTQPERTMTVCDVCGVFINSTDNEQRRKLLAQNPSAAPAVNFNQDHLNGKQYLGWKKIRETFDELTEKYNRVKREIAEQVYERPPERERYREHERERERGRPRESRERERERDYYYDERYERDYRSGPSQRDPYSRERGDYRRERDRGYYDDGYGGGGSRDGYGRRRY